MPVVTSFVRLTSDQAVEDALALLRALAPTHAVIERAAEPARRFFAFDSEELLEWLQAELRRRPGERPLLEDAVDWDARHLATAADPADHRARVDEESGPVVLLDGDRLVGLLVAEAAEDVHFGLSPGDQDDASATRRAVVASAPPAVQLGKHVSLLVKLAQELTLPGAAVVDVGVGEQLTIVVQTSPGLEVVEPSEGTLTVDDSDETLPLRFEIVGRREGPGKATVYAFRKGQALCAVKVAIAVTPGASDDAPVETRQRIHCPAGKEPDLSLIILEDRRDESYSMRLVGGGLDEHLCDSIRLHKDPEQYFRGFFAGIEQIIKDTVPLAEKMMRLEKWGTSLFEAVVPDRLRAELWELRRRIRTFQIQSDEPWIPWELCKLYGPGSDGMQVEEGFLCEQFQLTRWPLDIDEQPQPDLSLSDIGLVVPADSELSTAGAERRFMLGLGRGGRTVTTIPADAVELRKQLAAGKFDGLHFTGHGSSSADDIDRSTISLEKGGRLTPQDLTGVVENLGRRRPLVFLNACQVGRAAMSLTGTGGWPHGFLKAGAGAFIAPYWSVVDDSASAFAQTFYRELLDGGATVGQAVQSARADLKKASDPTWLAYTVYAHPDARVTGPKARDAT